MDVFVLTLYLFSFLPFIFRKKKYFSQNEQLNDQNSNGTPKIDAVEAAMVSPWLVSSDVVTTSSKPKAPVRKTVITTQL